MKKQKFGRQLKLHKETIAKLNPSGTANVVGGAATARTYCCVPCNRTIPTEVICTLYDCLTVHLTECVTNCPNC